MVNKQSSLIIDRGKKPKSREDHYPRDDGESYSFKIIVDGDIFFGMSYFGTKEAQEIHKERLIENWPKEITNGLQQNK
jgi:hypothetical protein